MINSFVEEEHITSIVEFGCGDGHQLSLMSYPTYIGFDVSATAVKICKEKFKKDPTKSFELFQPHSFSPHDFVSDVSLSLDVIYHLVEDEAFNQHMQSLFDTSRRFVIIYSDNQECWSSDIHVRHRRFSDWIVTNRPQWSLFRHVPNAFPYEEETKTGSWADFWMYSRSSKP